MDLNNRKMTNHPPSSAAQINYLVQFKKKIAKTKDNPTRAKTSSVQYGYRKSGTLARVLSQKLAHWSSKGKITHNMMVYLKPATIYTYKFQPFPKRPCIHVSQHHPYIHYTILYQGCACHSLTSIPT